MPHNDMRPSFEEFKKKKAHWEGVWSPAHLNFERAEQLVLGEYSIWGDERLNASRLNFHSPLASNVITHFLNAQSAYKWKVHREPVGDGEAHKLAANRVENTAQAILVSAGRESTALPWKSLYRYLAQDDYCILDIRADLSKAPKEPERKDFDSSKDYEKAQERWKRAVRYFNPIRLEAPNPKRVLLDPYEKQPEWAIHSSQMEAFRVEALSIEKAQKGRGAHTYRAGDNPYRMVRLDEHWTEEVHQVFAEDADKPLYEEENWWRFVPYIHAFGGQGFEVMNERGLNPEFLARPMLLAVRDIIIVMDQQMNARQFAFRRAAHGWLATSKEDATGITEQMARGDVITGVKKDEVFQWPLNEMPQWMFQDQQWLDQLLQEGTVRRITIGQNPRNVETVGQTAILKELADNTFNDSRHQVEDMASITISHTLRLTEALNDLGYLPDGLRVGKFQMDAKDIMGDYNAEATAELHDPVLLLQEKQNAREEVERGLMSRKRYWQVSRLEDDTAERDAILDDELDADPRFHGRLLAEQARKRGLNDFADELEAEADMALVGAPEPNGNGTGDLEEALAGTQDPERPQDNRGPLRQAARATRQIRKGLTNDIARPAPRRR